MFGNKQVEAGSKLFPAVFVKPTTSNMFQFELGRIKVKGFSNQSFHSCRH